MVSFFDKIQRELQGSIPSVSLSQDCACVHTFPSYSLKTALRENCVFFFFKYQPEERKPYSQESNLGFSAQFAQAE